MTTNHHDRAIERIPYIYALIKAGLADVTFHGLRKTAARKLAEASCTEAEIMAITGHKTSAMVSLYVRDANQEKLADAAILKLETKTE